MIRRELHPTGLRLVTEAMPHVRSVSIGVWLTRGSRHESDARSGIAHFVEHMLFKGTENRSAEDIAQEIDSIGGHLDAFTSKEYAGYYIKVLDEHLPKAVDLLSDIVRRPRFAPDDIEKEKKVILEEIKMVEDTPDDLVHEILTEQYWRGHPLGRPILGVPATVEALSEKALSNYFAETYVASNFIVSAAGNLDHDRLSGLLAEAFGGVRKTGPSVNGSGPADSGGVTIREKDLEQSHIAIASPAFPQSHDDRFAAYVLNTVFGGSMSSRLFQNIREKRGLAYAVFSGLTAYRDAGMLTVYAGCAAESVGEVIDLVIEEMRGMKREAITGAELRRSKDHLKGSLMLGLESTSSRMTHLARQDIYFDRHDTLDETLARIEAVTAEGIEVLVRESIPNCPKYIQRRQPTDDPAIVRPPSRAPERGHAIDADRRAFVERADTAFVGSLHAERGVDASHRGGAPGFIQVVDPSTLRVPDYAGNSMFLTLGNYAADPRASLAVLNFDRGQVLSFSGEARLRFDGERPDLPTGGTGRYWELAVREWVQFELPWRLRWDLIDASPNNPPKTTGRP
jgi:predicted Zn-dependent peptidase